MAIIKFKTRSLIRRFGTKPVIVPDNLAKQFLDRGQAESVRKKIIEEDPVPIEEAKGDVEEEENEVIETEDKGEEVEEEKFEIKIKKTNKDE